MGSKKETVIVLERVKGREMKKLSGLTKQELKLEKIVDEIKSLTAIEGIVILKNFRDKEVGKAIKSIQQAGAIEELTKAKSLTEHLNQQERNEYFETRLKKLAE
jgi:hypothetical protein